MAVINGGVIEQVAAPLEIFARPATTFVAQFVGTPSMNLWPGTLARNGGVPRVTTASFALNATDSALVTAAGAGSNIVIGVRPHDIGVASIGGGDVDGIVELVEALGAWATMHVRVGTDPELVRVAALSGPAARPGDRVGLRLRRDRLHLFDAATRRNLLTS
jgi:ABC-type sugar transport system ATPase subunit